MTPTSTALLLAAVSNPTIVPLLKIERSGLLRTPQQRFPMLFNWPDNPQNCSFLWKISTPYSTRLNDSLDPQESILQTASRSVQPFLHSTSLWPAHRQTDIQTDRPRLRATSVAIGRIASVHCVHALRPKKYCNVKWCARTSLLFMRSFSVSAPSTWNSLPQQIRSIDRLSTFKRQLKSHFFQSAFTV